MNLELLSAVSIFFAVMFFATTLMALSGLFGAASAADGMEAKIRELEGQKHTAISERDKATRDRDEWRSVWISTAARLGSRLIELATERESVARLKAENESLVASVNYWKNATTCKRRRESASEFEKLRLAQPDIIA